MSFTGVDLGAFYQKAVFLSRSDSAIKPPAEARSVGVPAAWVGVVSVSVSMPSGLLRG